MRFFCINKSLTGSRTEYSVILFSGEFPKDTIKDHIGDHGEISLNHWGSIVMAFYYYHSDSSKYVYCSSEIQLNTVTPKVLPELAGHIAKLEDFRIGDMLRMLAGRGWMQKFYDPRSSSYYLDSNYPAVDKVFYKIAMTYTFDNENQKRVRQFSVFATSDTDARTAILGQFPAYIEELRQEYGDDRAQGLMNAVSKWITSGMSFDRITPIDQARYDECFTGVHPKAIYDDIAPAKVDSPSEAVNV